MAVFKRNPQGAIDAQPAVMPPPEMLPPNLLAPVVPVQYAGVNPYQQQYHQQMQSTFSTFPGGSLLNSILKCPAKGKGTASAVCTVVAIKERLLQNLCDQL